MCLVSSVEQMVQPLSETMTAPTFETFQTPLTGWGLTSRRLVTRMILAAGSAATKHYSSCHCFFSQARRSRDQLGLALLGLLQPWLDERVNLDIDETLARKRGSDHVRLRHAP